MINRKLVETPVRMMNRMEEITDLICEYNEEVQKQQQEIERLNNIINEFEKWLENEIKFQKITDNDYFLRKAQRKLQELKRGDKE